MRHAWSGPNWEISLSGTSLTVKIGDRPVTIEADDATSISLGWSWFRPVLRHPTFGRVRLRGLQFNEARAIPLAQTAATALAWVDEFRAICEDALDVGRWIPLEVVSSLESRKPSPQVARKLSRGPASRLLDAAELIRLEDLFVDVSARLAKFNQAIFKNELNSESEFLRSIEQMPLSEQQAEAVITFDNRVQVVAAAGSGKTSVMVARAGYAVKKGFVRPERILLLAFNKAAAVELQTRVESRLKAAGIDPSGIRASTFHAFGLSVIGQSRGAKPRVAPWIDSGRDTAVVEEIVDQLRRESADFAFMWDQFRLLFADMVLTPGGGRADGYDHQTSKTGVKTFSGALVRSHGERLIANWLYLNHVDFEYERPYVVRTATPEHSQYRPDFYYPKADLWHEHWALDRHGNPPSEFTGYRRSMEWKKQVHEQHRTKLIETTWFDVVFGDGLQHLAAQLREHGIEPRWDPGRVPSTSNVVSVSQLSRLIRTFMTHVKSSKFGQSDVEERLRTSHVDQAGTRTNLFMSIYWQVQRAWNERLSSGEYVDFEDMLSIAADSLADGAYSPPYDLILVDELQDASQARARLVQGLLRQPGKYLLAVGDDWQSINRFAGADISVMTKFTEWFGEGPRLQLTTTYRCPQTICGVSSSFVSTNPQQIPKTVQSIQSGSGFPVRIIESDKSHRGLLNQLNRISDRVAVLGDSDKVKARASVYLLGRYRFDELNLDAYTPTNLDLKFSTVHGVKGLEADFVIVLNAKTGTYGFPSQIADDPLLDLVMAGKDGFAFAEERRLFYVALTRARQEVAILAESGFESPFVFEISGLDGVEWVASDGRALKDKVVCPKCKGAFMRRKRGKRGDFLSCSLFPECRGSMSIPKEPEQPRKRWTF